jgi:hypothetical protein
MEYWVFGGPWTYDEEPRGEATGADKEFLQTAMARGGDVVGGRNTYEAAEAWAAGVRRVPFFIVTHERSEGTGGVSAPMPSVRPYGGRSAHAAATT